MAEQTWKTAITQIEPNKVIVRGYRIDELMGRISFGEMVYLVLKGELPTPEVGLLMDAMLVSSVDHGVTPPSALASRTIASGGAPLTSSSLRGLLVSAMLSGITGSRSFQILATCATAGTWASRSNPAPVSAINALRSICSGHQNWFDLGSPGAVAALEIDAAEAATANAANKGMDRLSIDLLPSCEKRGVSAED